MWKRLPVEFIGDRKSCHGRSAWDLSVWSINQSINRSIESHTLLSIVYIHNAASPQRTWTNWFICSSLVFIPSYFTYLNFVWRKWMIKFLIIAKSDFMTRMRKIGQHCSDGSSSPSITQHLQTFSVLPLLKILPIPQQILLHLSPFISQRCLLRLREIFLGESWPVLRRKLVRAGHVIRPRQCVLSLRYIPEQLRQSWSWIHARIALLIRRERKCYFTVENERNYEWKILLFDHQQSSNQSNRNPTLRFRPIDWLIDWLTAFLPSASISRQIDWLVDWFNWQIADTMLHVLHFEKEHKYCTISTQLNSMNGHLHIHTRIAPNASSQISMLTAVKSSVRKSSAKIWIFSSYVQLCPFWNEYIFHLEHPLEVY